MATKGRVKWAKESVSEKSKTPRSLSASNVTGGRKRVSAAKPARRKSTEFVTQKGGRRSAGQLPFSAPEIQQYLKGIKRRKSPLYFEGGDIHGRTSPRWKYNIVWRPEQAQQIAQQIANSKPNCASAQEILKFIDRIKSLHYNGADVRAIIQTAKLHGLLQKKPVSAKSRFAEGAFLPELEGLEGGKVSPTLLWQVANRYQCNLGELNKMLDQILAREYGVKQVVGQTAKKPTAASRKVNQTLFQEAQAITAANPQCKGAENAIYDFLNLIDQSHLTGSQLVGTIRTAGLEGLIEPLYSFNSRYTRVGKQGLGLTQGTTEATKNDLKLSLVYNIVDKYCTQLNKLVPWLTWVLQSEVAEIETQPQTARQPILQPTQQPILQPTQQPILQPTKQPIYRSPTPLIELTPKLVSLEEFGTPVENPYTPLRRYEPPVENPYTPLRKYEPPIDANLVATPRRKGQTGIQKKQKLSPSIPYESL